MGGNLCGGVHYGGNLCGGYSVGGNLCGGNLGGCSPIDPLQREVGVSLQECLCQHIFYNVGGLVLISSSVEGVARVEHLVQVAHFLRGVKGQQHQTQRQELPCLVYRSASGG